MDTERGIIMKHLIIIPTYNEAQTVEKITDAIFSRYDSLNILVVDSSSPDGTADIIKNLQKKYNRLFLLTEEKKSGLANAYKIGMKWGLENGFDAISTCDADFSHNPKHFAEIIQYLNEGYEAIFGSRYIKGGNTQEKNWFRNFISIGGNHYARLIIGKEIYDWTGGFNTYTKSALEKIDLNSLKANGYILNAEIKYKAVHSGCKYKEFGIDFAEREKGKSKMDFRIIFEAFLYVFKIKRGA